MQRRQAIAGPEIERLIQLLAKLPGLGPRSARRCALHLLDRRESLLSPLCQALDDVAENVTSCAVCSNLDSRSPCAICTDVRRDLTVLCVVEDVASLWALERTAMLNCHYHVLGGSLSPLDGIGPEQLSIGALIERIKQGTIREVILALSATVEGQTTAHYITDLVNDKAVSITRLAQGVPIGGELDYLDEGTLAAALQARVKL